MDSEVTAFIQYLQDQRLITDYINVATIAVLIYDYVLTLHLEIKLIWVSQWSYTKVLFLIIRYMTFVCVLIIAYSQTYPDISEESCKVLWPMQAWLSMLLVICAELVLAIRTWAIWNRNNVVGVGLLASILAVLIVGCIWLKAFTNSFQYAPSPYLGFRGCFITRVDKGLWKVYSLLTAFEFVVFCLVAISAFRSYTFGNVSRFTHVIHRDGILFYVYLLCLTAANIATTDRLTEYLMPLLTSIETCLYSVFTTRIVLNVREEGNRGTQVELHTGYDQSQSLAIDLQTISEDLFQDTPVTSSQALSEFRTFDNRDTF